MQTSRLRRWTAIFSISIVVLSGLSWASLGKVTSSLKRVDVFGGLNNRPVRASSAVNYLLVGSDTREGLTPAQLKALRVGSVRSAAGKRSDTMLLVHISKARDKATIISLPRDTYVQIPAYKDQSGNLHSASHSKLNAAFSWGGAPLLIQTIEAATNLHIDHYVEINFAGFANVVDSLGGIQVCSRKDINDPKSHLVLAKGVHILDGITALKYVRTRDFDGMGDLGRMQRQQQFMSAVIRKATSAGVLLNPVKFLNFMDSALSALTTDSGLTKDDLITLAQQVRGLSTSKIRTLTVPLSNVGYFVPSVGSTVVWDPVLAPELWQRLINDQAVVDEVTVSPTPSSTKSSKNESTSVANGNSSSPSASPSPSVTIIDKFKTRTAAENPCGVLKY